MDAITNGATIEIVATGERFHTLNDWGLAIGNNDYIGDVEQENYYVDVPGADGFLDFSEAITGRRIFKNRPISIELGGKKPRDNWDIFISDLRNLVEGREIKVIFDNDSGFYWTGRASIQGYDRNREIGTFTLAIPKADPYKYNVADSTEDWLWDSFDFETGIIDEGTEITVRTGDVHYRSGSDAVRSDNIRERSGISGTQNDSKWGNLHTDERKEPFCGYHSQYRGRGAQFHWNGHAHDPVQEGVTVIV